MRTLQLLAFPPNSSNEGLPINAQQGIDKTHGKAPLSFMDAAGRLELLRALLRGPLRVSNVEANRFPVSYTTPDQVVVTHRLILIRHGEIDYTVDEIKRRTRAGDWLWVPAWSRRQWRVAAGSDCEIVWCEFATDPVTVPPQLVVAKPAGTEPEAALARMLALWPVRSGADELRLEAEAKWLAAEFWTTAEPDHAAGSEGGSKPRHHHAEIRRAVAWLEEHFARPEALAAFYQTLELSPNHFRLLFRREMGETVQATLARLRMRRARYLVVETALSMKEIAMECGFNDPLYFSLHYRRFWGRPPSADREGTAVA